MTFTGRKWILFNTTQKALRSLLSAGDPNVFNAAVLHCIYSAIRLLVVLPW